MEFSFQYQLFRKPLGTLKWNTGCACSVILGVGLQDVVVPPWLKFAKRFVRFFEMQFLGVGLQAVVVPRSNS